MSSKPLQLFLLPSHQPVLPLAQALISSNLHRPQFSHPSIKIMMAFAAGVAWVGHSVREGDCERVWAEPGQVQGTALPVCHWVTPTTEEPHPGKASRQLRTSQTILWDRFHCLQEPQITKLPCKTLTFYYFQWVWWVLCPNTSQFFQFFVMNT